MWATSTPASWPTVMPSTATSRRSSGRPQCSPRWPPRRPPDSRVRGCHPAPVTRIEVPERDLIGIRAANPGPFTLSGTNSWIIGRDPAWLIDPGPDLGEHIAALIAEIDARGGLGGVALTHGHADHTGGVTAIRARYPDAPIASARNDADVQLV